MQPAPLPGWPKAGGPSCGCGAWPRTWIADITPHPRIAQGRLGAPAGAPTHLSHHREGWGATQAAVTGSPRVLGPELLRQTTGGRGEDAHLPLPPAARPHAPGWVSTTELDVCPGLQVELAGRAGGWRKGRWGRLGSRGHCGAHHCLPSFSQGQSCTPASGPRARERQRDRGVEPPAASTAPTHRSRTSPALRDAPRKVTGMLPAPLVPPAGGGHESARGSLGDVVLGPLHLHLWQARVVLCFSILPVSLYRWLNKCWSAPVEPWSPSPYARSVVFKVWYNRFSIIW